jgi:proline iminopeptidase
VIAQAPSLFSNQRRIFWTQLHGFSQIASQGMKVKIDNIIKSEISLQEKYHQVWNIADQATVDKFLFKNQKIAEKNRTMWEESKLINTGLMFQAIQDEKPSSDLLLKLKFITTPVLLLVGLYDRNVGLDLVRDFHAALVDSQMVIFNYSAHFPDLEELPRFTNEIVSFLS